MIKDFQESSQKFKQKKHNIKIILGVTFIFFVLIFIGVIDILIKDNKENEEIKKMEQKAYLMSQKNQEIKDLISNYNSPTNKESVARDSLNVMKEGENVVVFNDEKKEIKIDDIKNNKNKKENIPNYKKWINFFFENKQK